MNLTGETLARLELQVGLFTPFVTRHRVASAALNLGLELLERNPDLLVEFFSNRKRDES